MQRSRIRENAAEALGEDLGNWVARQRTEEDLNWAQIARKLARVTADTEVGPVITSRQWIYAMFCPASARGSRRHAA